MVVTKRTRGRSEGKRAVIRVESAETQDNVSGLQGLEELVQKDIEELSLVSEPLWALHMCDNKCREEGFKFFQLAAFTINSQEMLHRKAAERR